MMEDGRSVFVFLVLVVAKADRFFLEMAYNDGN